MTDPLFTVLSAKVLEAPDYRSSGDAIIAELTIEYGAILMVGCKLIVPPEGGHKVWLPSARAPARILLRGPARNDILQVALAACGLDASNSAETPLAKATLEGTLNDPSRHSRAPR